MHCLHDYNFQENFATMHDLACISSFFVYFDFMYYFSTDDMNNGKHLNTK